jgi:demethylmenaquinone methyltransferase/2-methoxy-6-polyprenyl-1,4-benzoquinol methylase
MFHKPKPTPAPGTDPSATTDWHAVDWRSYDDVAGWYAKHVADRHAPAASDLMSLLEPPPGGRVLDVGTGTGIALQPAAAAVGERGLVVGLDPSLGMLLQAKSAGVPGSLVGGEAIDLPFPDESFDRVLANFVVSHFARPENALFDMVRVLRSRGRMGVSAWGGAEDEFSRTWREIGESFVGKDLYRDAVVRGLPSEARFSDPKRLEEAVGGAGLRNVRVEHRDYRFEMTIEEYLAGQDTRMVARALRRIMGDAIWTRFTEQVADEFRSRFRDPIGDTRDVYFGLGTKP